jgi:hypothetical protein
MSHSVMVMLKRLTEPPPYLVCVSVRPAKHVAAAALETGEAHLLAAAPAARFILLHVRIVSSIVVVTATLRGSRRRRRRCSHAPRA